MRTGTKKCILLLLAIIVLCFAVWLLWPKAPGKPDSSSKSEEER